MAESVGKTTTGSALYLFQACRAKVGDPLAKLVLIALADRANDSGVCWPSIGVIAEQCETGRRTVERKLSYLEDLGVIRRSSRAKDGRKTSNSYQIIWMRQSDASTANQMRHSDVSDASESRNGCVTVTHRSSHRNSHRSSQGNTPPTPPTKVDRQQARFDYFWEHYPRKTSKAAARKAFSRADPDDRLTEVIVEHCRSRVEQGDWDLEEKQFIPHASTFLNNQRWEDEIVPRDSKATPKRVADKTATLISKIDQEGSWL